jgi:5'-nucleotidase
VGFSLCDYGPKADFSHAAEWVRQVCQHALAHGIPIGTALNVNIPKKSETPIAGLRLARQAHAKWQEEFDRRLDPYQRPYFWLRGEFVNFDTGTDTDEWALAHNYVSVVPCQFDLTAAHGLAHLSQQWQLPLPDAADAVTPPQPVAPEDYGVANPN